jgi:phosphomethylpyrimidine synthase
MKDTIKSNKEILIGYKTRTLLNLLLGFNAIREIRDEMVKMIAFSDKSYEIDIITDLSLYRAKKGDRLWERVIDETECMAGTVPIYLSLDKDDLVDIHLLKENIFEQCEKGVSIITIHPTPTRELINMCQGRLIKWTSRGGGIVINDLLRKGTTENVFIKTLDDIIKICKKYNTIISIGSSFRTATIIDAMDRAYLKELNMQLKIAKYIKKRGGKIIIETPGHADPDSIKRIGVILKKFPFPIMPLGPVPTDVAFEQDDTAAVIGAVLMGTQNCADILSIVTNQEHSGGLPTIDALKEAISKYKVAKHIIDINKIGNKDFDFQVSSKRNMESSCSVKNDEECVRCGKLCSLRLLLPETIQKLYVGSD